MQSVMVHRSAEPAGAHWDGGIPNRWAMWGVYIGGTN